ncbi:MAG: ribosome maturation factor RimP [Thermoflavifilum sp.]|nr:ribosome maturation factor RimP [Thermoflavifilum sp.]MCL6513414.1 ribosome maturation factor RimP [Alicyclobacillus sp.]
MPRERVTEIVEELAQPIAEAAGVEVVDVEYKKEGSHWFLRVYIDKPGGVDIDDCSRFSEVLSERLDEVDPIPGAYFLEVSSPGAERPLKKPADFERAVGEYVRISLYEPVAGQKVLEGVLREYGSGRLVVEQQVRGRSQDVEVPLDKVASARLAIQF